MLDLLSIFSPATFYKKITTKNDECCIHYR
jgi:hypothetical protein